MQSRIEIKAGAGNRGGVCVWVWAVLFAEAAQLARINRHARALDTSERNKSEQSKQNAN